MLAENVLVHNSYSERANLSNTVASNLEINRAREKVTKKGSQNIIYCQSINSISNQHSPSLPLFSFHLSLPPFMVTNIYVHVYTTSCVQLADCFLSLLPSEHEIKIPVCHPILVLPLILCGQRTLRSVCI